MYSIQQFNYIDRGKTVKLPDVQYKHLIYNQEFLNQVSRILAISGCSPDPVT